MAIPNIKDHVQSILDDYVPQQPDARRRCLEMIAPLLSAKDRDVRKAVSFAIRLAARGEVEPVRDFLAHHVPPDDPTATWVLCDAVRKMSKKLQPDFAPLLPQYEQWAADPDLSGRHRRSVESAIRRWKKHSARPYPISAS